MTFTLNKCELLLSLISTHVHMKNLIVYIVLKMLVNFPFDSYPCTHV